MDVTVFGRTAVGNQYKPLIYNFRYKTSKIKNEKQILI